MSFDFRSYVKSILVEQSRVSGANISAVDASNYKEQPPGSGIFVSKTGKDPYTYSIVSHNSKQAVIKVESTSLANRQSAVGRTFKITKNNLDNPNVQLLYASLLNLGKLTRIAGDTDNFKIGNLTAEIIITGPRFAHLNFFKEQHDEIKKLGHENASSTLVYKNPVLGPQNPPGNGLNTQLQNLIKTIEDKTGDQVVSLILQPKVGYYMAKENPLKYVHSVFELEIDSDFMREIANFVDDTSTTGGPDSQTKNKPGDDNINISVDPEVKPETFVMISKSNPCPEHTKLTLPESNGLKHDQKGGITGNIKNKRDAGKIYFIQDGGSNDNCYKRVDGAEPTNEFDRYKIVGYGESFTQSADGRLVAGPLNPIFELIN